MHRNRELRKVPVAILDPVIGTLEINDDWKKVMSLIPKNLQSDRFEPKYNSEHIRLIEQHAQKTNMKCAQILFDEWGTSGRIRPTLHTLMDILIKAQIYRAADSLASILNEKSPPRPNDGPAANIETSVTLLLNNESMEQTQPAKLIQNNGTTNGTYGNLHNAPTKPMKSHSPIQYPEDSWSNNIPDFGALGYIPTTQMPTKPQEKEFPTPDLVNTNHIPTDEYMPAFSKLIPQSDSIDTHSNSVASGAFSNTESSQFISDGTTQSEPLQSSSYRLPSSRLIDVSLNVDNEILENTNLINFKYAELAIITKHFSDSHIGSGGFGDVFVGTHEKYGRLAIKRAHNLNSGAINLAKIFNTEVKSLTLLRHENIVPILGYSLDGQAPCIVCEYIEGGSLLENIAAKVLNETQRMNIMTGTAEGLRYIHTTVKPTPDTGAQNSRNAYFLHGDVKSANILITRDFVPKLCDFGLSKECVTTFHTESIMGTQAYMAPERFSGTITQKGDIYSYGIVLLELLTGLEPIITDNNENLQILLYIQENIVDDDITSLLDPLIKDWSKAQPIYELAKLCVETRKNKRPPMATICDMLYEIKHPQQKVFYADV